MCRILWLINVHVWDELVLRVGEFKYLGDADAVLICCGSERAEHEGKTFNLPVDLHSCPVGDGYLLLTEKMRSQISSGNELPSKAVWALSSILGEHFG